MFRMYRKKVKAKSDENKNDKKNNSKKSKPNPKAKRKTESSIKNSTRSRKTLTNKSLKDILNDANAENGGKKGSKSKKNSSSTSSSTAIINSDCNNRKKQALVSSSQKRSKRIETKKFIGKKINSAKSEKNETHNMESQPSTSGTQSGSLSNKQNKKQSTSKEDRRDKSEKERVDSKSKLGLKSKGIQKAKSRRKSGRRVASLNASAKVKLLCENDKNGPKSKKIASKIPQIVKTGSDDDEDEPTESLTNEKKMKDSKNTKSTLINKNKKMGKRSNNKNKKKQASKRKLIKTDPEVEIIDTKRCKRMASLNASAMMAATYLPEKEKKRQTTIDSDNQTVAQSSNQETVGQMVHEWSSTVEERIEMTTVQTMVQLGHDNTIVETISTQYEQQNKILAKRNSANNNVEVNKEKRNVISDNKIKSKKSAAIQKGCSSTTKASTVSKAFTSSPSNSPHQASTSSFSGDSVPAVVRHSTVSTSNLASQNFPALSNCHVVVPVNDGVGGENRPSTTKRRRSKSKSQSAKKNIHHQNNSDGNVVQRSSNNGQANSIVQKYIRKIETRLESSSTSQSTNSNHHPTNYNPINCLPNGIAFINDSRVKNPIISANSAPASTIGNNLPYGILNPAPFQIIPFVSHIQPYPQSTMASMQSTSNFSPLIPPGHGNNLQSLNSNSFLANYTPPSALYQSSSNTVGNSTTPYAANHQSGQGGFSANPIPLPVVQLTPPFLPLVPNGNIQSNSLFGISYLNGANNSFSMPTNQYVNLLGSNMGATSSSPLSAANSRLLHRPVPFNPQSGQLSTTAPFNFNGNLIANTTTSAQQISAISPPSAQIINVNGPNLFANHPLFRQPSITSIRPLSFPINACFPQPTLLVQTPAILNANTFSFGHPNVTNTNASVAIPVMKNLYNPQTANTFIKTTNSLHIPRPITITDNDDDGAENLDGESDNIISNASDNLSTNLTNQGPRIGQSNEIRSNHQIRGKNKKKSRKNRKHNNDVLNHSDSLKETDTKKLITNGYPHPKTKPKQLDKINVTESNDLKPVLRNQRRKLLLSDNKDNHSNNLTDVDPTPPLIQPNSSTVIPAILPTFNRNRKNRRPIIHGWSWEGEPFQKNIFVNNDEQSFSRTCYPAIKHNEGEIIRVRDCVLLKSGPRKTDLPFVAKIASLWESPEKDMMMSLLWYYRPEHTETQENYSNGELYASRHRDTNSVACIDDKCFVLTFNEYCRYKRQKTRQLQPLANLQPDKTKEIVPNGLDAKNDENRLPPSNTLPELVFCCRKVYDFRQKRILKNPS